MALVEWSDSLTIGVEKFDGHHRRLADVINRLDDSLSGRDRRDTVGTILRELIDYTIYHFRAEEEFMQQIGFPGFGEHRRMHNQLVRGLQDKIDLFLRNRPIEISLLAFLHDWLIDHIMVEDRKYSDYAVSARSEIQDGFGAGI